MTCHSCKADKGAEHPDSRTHGWLQGLVQGHPVLGPGLGGGVTGVSLNASGSLPTPGGGIEPRAVTHVNAPILYPAVRQDVHFDFSTPTGNLIRGVNPQCQAMLDHWGDVGTTQA